MSNENIEVRTTDTGSTDEICHKCRHGYRRTKLPLEDGISEDEPVDISDVKSPNFELHCLLKLIFDDGKINYIINCIIDIENYGVISADHFFSDIKLIYCFLQNDNTFGDVTQAELEENGIIIREKFQLKQVEINKLNLKKVELGIKLLENAEQFKIIKKNCVEVPWKRLLRKILIIQHIHKVCENIETLKNLDTPNLSLPLTEMLKLQEIGKVKSHSISFVNFIGEILEMHYICKKIFEAVGEIQENGSINIFNWKIIFGELKHLKKLMKAKYDGSYYGKNFTVIDKNASVVTNLKFEVIKILAETHKMPKCVVSHGNKSLNESPVHYNKMKYEFPGLMVCVNNIHYEGIKKSCGTKQNDRALTNLFKQFQFRTQVHRDLKCAELLENFRILSQEKILEKIGCFILVAMGFGVYNNNCNITHFTTIDNHLVAIDDIIKIFDYQNCPALREKPRIFIFPIYRINDHHCSQRDCLCVDPEKHNKNPDFISHKAEMQLVAYLLPGNSSNHHRDRPKYLIDVMYEVFRKHAHDTNIEDLFKLIQNHGVLRKLLFFESNLTKTCYLNIKL